MPKPPLTARGAERLRQQLAELKSADRPRVIKAIAEARAHGDLSENAEYHAAREQQGFIEGRIAALESVLAQAQIIDITLLNPGGRVVFGATVSGRPAEVPGVESMVGLFINTLPVRARINPD